MLPDPSSDPFGERLGRPLTRQIQLLGAKVRFDSNSKQLMDLVDWAYNGLPRQRLSSAACELRVSMLLSRGAEPHRRAEPPPLAMISGCGLLGGATDRSDFVVMSPREHRALVVVSPAMLRSPYHARYELIEFAVFTLAARAQKLVSLHAACVGRKGRGILLIGPSGSGKSTLTLHCLLNGFDFLSEDSAFVNAQAMLATGVSNFAHFRPDSLRWLGKSREAALVRASPVIRRRSGVRKFEVNLRRPEFRLAKTPQKIVSVVFLSPQGAGNRPLLRPLSKPALLAGLDETQGYAAGHSQWREFRGNVSRLDAFELRRGNHPLEAVDALRSVLAGR